MFMSGFFLFAFHSYGKYVISINFILLDSQPYLEIFLQQLTINRLPLKNEQAI